MRSSDKCLMSLSHIMCLHNSHTMAHKTSRPTSEGGCSKLFISAAWKSIITCKEKKSKTVGNYHWVDVQKYLFIHPFIIVMDNTIALSLDNIIGIYQENQCCKIRLFGIHVFRSEKTVYCTFQKISFSFLMNHIFFKGIIASLCSNISKYNRCINWRWSKTDFHSKQS